MKLIHFGCLVLAAAACTNGVEAPISRGGPVGGEDSVPPSTGGSAGGSFGGLSFTEPVITADRPPLR